MAVNDPIWSLGKSKIIKSSGTTVTNNDDIWSYGIDELYHEYYFIPISGNIRVNINDSWKTINNLYVNVNDSWKSITNVYVNISDNWKEIL